ncbi:MAG TPA: hypothetical protein VLV55_13075 [Rhizomicrobium sp.]|nr:hypothetical protein [Rhizomicrobium sp.]
MRIGLAVALALLLSACASEPAAQPVSVCPPVAAYTKADEVALADAVSALPPDNPLIGAMLDYGRLRAAALACASP